MGKKLIPEQPVEAVHGELDIIGWHQTDDYSCGYAAAVTLLKHFGVRFKRDELWDELAPCPDMGVTTGAALKALRARGLVVTVKPLTAETLKAAHAANLPTLVSARLDGFPRCEEHWMIVAGVNSGHALLLNQPNANYDRIWWSISKLRRRSSEKTCWVVRCR